MAYFPNFLGGMIAGLFGLGVTAAIKWFKQANYEIVAYSVSAIVVALEAMTLLFGYQREGLSLNMIETLANAFGVIAGLFMAQQQVKENQQRVMATP
jgi:hypothetical protein